MTGGYADWSRVLCGPSAGRQVLRCFLNFWPVNREVTMLGWAVVFLIVGLVAAVLGFSGIAGTAVNIAWILAVVGIVVAIVFFVLGRRPPLS
jgi:uncharacterized membrane protein YtjA (UPF0391 family)